MNCQICNKPNAHRHHIISRGAYGSAEAMDNPDNIIYLCAEHHNAVHTMGRNSFFKLYGLEKVLDKALEIKYNYNKNGGAK